MNRLLPAKLAQIFLPAITYAIISYHFPTFVYAAATDIRESVRNFAADKAYARMENLNSIIAQACSLLGAEEQRLFSTNMENYVDARALIFTLFFDLGLTDSETARMCHVSRQSVNKLRNGFRERMRKWTVRQAYKELKQNLNS